MYTHIDIGYKVPITTTCDIINKRDLEAIGLSVQTLEARVGKDRVWHGRARLN
jgi:hypothetical protein